MKMMILIAIHVLKKIQIPVDRLNQEAVPILVEVQALEATMEMIKQVKYFFIHFVGLVPRNLLRLRALLVYYNGKELI